MDIFINFFLVTASIGSRAVQLEIKQVPPDKVGNNGLSESLNLDSLCVMWYFVVAMLV